MKMVLFALIYFTTLCLVYFNVYYAQSFTCELHAVGTNVMVWKSPS